MHSSKAVRSPQKSVHRPEPSVGTTPLGPQLGEIRAKADRHMIQVQLGNKSLLSNSWSECTPTPCVDTV